jgi:hypothetical protein
MKTILRTTLISILGLCVGGCAIGTTRVAITPSPLAASGNQRAQTILVQTFKDVRQDDHKYIGNKRNGLGMSVGRIGLERGKTLETLVTEAVAQALRHSGYNAVLQGQPGSKAPSAILSGEIKSFWMDMYMKAWHHVGLRLILRDRSGQHVKWERSVEGDESYVLWLAITPEFERVINSALDNALRKAAANFASEEFARAVRE